MTLRKSPRGKYPDRRSASVSQTTSSAIFEEAMSDFGAICGANMAMPILVINMGGEMVYILAQRLRAQNVTPEKSTKVLGDVIKTMYYPKFIEELFKPQMMYSKQSVREIFHKLAHSSIMRLNESSMEKLFDLMAMGVKYQIVRCAFPRDVLAVFNTFYFDRQFSICWYFFHDSFEILFAVQIYLN